MDNVALHKVCAAYMYYLLVTTIIRQEYCVDKTSELTEPANINVRIPECDYFFA